MVNQALISSAIIKKVIQRIAKIFDKLQFYYQKRFELSRFYGCFFVEKSLVACMSQKKYLLSLK